MLQYGTGRYGGYAAPYTPFRRNRVAIAYRYANFLPASHRNSRSAPYTSRSPTDSNGINPTAGVTLPRPPLRTFCPKNPTWEKHSPWTLSPEGMRQRIF